MANQFSDNVMFFDGKTRSSSLLHVGVHPQALAVNETTNKIYVVNYDCYTVTVIDGAAKSNLSTTPPSHQLQ